VLSYKEVVQDRQEKNLRGAGKDSLRERVDDDLTGIDDRPLFRKILSYTNGLI